MVLVLFLFLNCSYKIKRTDYVTKPIKPLDCEVVISDNAVFLGIEKEDYGKVTLSAGDFATLFKDSALQILKREACSIGANYVNIVSEKYLNKNKNGYACFAELYKVDFDYLNSLNLDVTKRDTLSFNHDRELNWDDFKGVPQFNDSSNLAADIYTSIKIEIRDVNAWLGYATYNISGVIFRDISWVLPVKRTTSLLEHQQRLFDISEIFALKLQNKLNKAKINLASNKRIKALFDSSRKDMYLYQDKYKHETQNGQDMLANKKWNQKIKNKLLELIENEL